MVDITTAGSAAKCAACERLGAERALNYRETDFVAAIREATGGRGVDVVLDMVGGDYLPRNLDVLAVDVDETLRAVLPDVRSSTGVVVIGRARAFNSVDTGLQPGDVIASLNRTAITSVVELRAAAASVKRGEPVVLRIERLGRFRYLTFDME